MRVNKLIQLGRLELYIGCPSIRSYAWRIDRTRHGYDIVLGRMQFIVDWLPSKREGARRNAEWLAEADAKLDAVLLAKARSSWPDRAAP